MRYLVFALLWSSSLSIQAADKRTPVANCFKAVADMLDFRRDWGVRLLEDDHPAFLDPSYHKRLIASAHPGAVGMDSEWPGRHDDVYFDWWSEWSRLTSSEPVRFANSGTAANNMLFEFAEHAYKVRTGRNSKRPHVLYFKEPYAGVHGRVSEMSIRYDTDPKFRKTYEIPSPQVTSMRDSEIKDLAAVKRTEDEAIAFIRKQVANKKLEVGAVFIEPMPATKGVYFYRPEFMLRLRALCDELKVPIFADEVLTGGGRTGKFFAWENYPGFQPDLVTFGKGMVVSGIANVRRFVQSADRKPALVWDWPVAPDNTSRANAMSIVQSTQVLRTISDGHLIDAAAKNGRYFVDQLRRRARDLGHDPNDIRGSGFLIYAGREGRELLSEPVDDYGGRFTPPLTLTRETIDRLLPKN